MRIPPSVFSTFVSVALLLGPATVQSSPVIDQSYNAVAAGSNGGLNVELDQQVAQTFKVGISGTLAGVEVQARVSTDSSPSDDLILDIRPTLGGMPVEDDSLILASVRVPITDVPPFVPLTDDFVSVDLRPFSLHVRSGDLLAIVLRQFGTGSYIWLAQFESLGETYENGAGFSRRFDPNWGRLIPETDFGFRTSVPEPTMLALLGFALAGLAASRRPKPN